MSIEAMKQALEALDAYSWEQIDAATKTLRQAIEQAEKQEPVAWITDGGRGELWWYRSSKFDEEGNLLGDNPDDVPLYTAPPKREWVGLTDEEIYDYADKFLYRHGSNYGIKSFGKAVEAKLKENNGG